MLVELTDDSESFPAPRVDGENSAPGDHSSRPCGLVRWVSGVDTVVSNSRKTPLVEAASPPFVQQLSIHRPCRLGYDAVTWAYAQEHVQAKFIVAGDMREQCLYIGVVTFERLL